MRYDVRIDDGETFRVVSILIRAPGLKLKKTGADTLEIGNNISIFFNSDTIQNIKEIDDQKLRQDQVTKLLSQIPARDTAAILPILIKQLQDRKRDSIAEDINGEDEEFLPGGG